MTFILTGKARLEQVKARLWKTIDNQLVELDDAKLLIAPRYLITDNNTNPFGDNDLSDVRASHFHDIGCRYHELIFVNKSRKDLLKEGYLHPHYNDKNELISVLEDLPLSYLEIKKCSYNYVNNIFKQILKASGEKTVLVNLMYMAVWHNLKFLFDNPKPLEKSILFKKEYGNVKTI